MDLFIKIDETMNLTVKESMGTLLLVVYELLIHVRSYFCFGSRVRAISIFKKLFTIYCNAKILFRIFSVVVPSNDFLKNQELNSLILVWVGSMKYGGSFLKKNVP